MASGAVIGLVSLGSQASAGPYCSDGTTADTTGPQLADYRDLVLSAFKAAGASPILEGTPPDSGAVVRLHLGLRDMCRREARAVRAGVARAIRSVEYDRVRVCVGGDGSGEAKAMISRTFRRRVQLASALAALAFGGIAEDAMANPPGTAGGPELAPLRPVAGAQAGEEASTRFKRGLQLFDEGDYALALVEFERAYQLAPNYRALYNIGLVNVQLGRYAEATRTVRPISARRRGMRLPLRERSRLRMHFRS